MKKVYSASITPVTDKRELDEISFERMIKRNLRHGLDGFFFFGSMGEWIEASIELKKRLLSLAVELVSGDAEILAGITGASVNDSIRQMEELAEIPFDSFALTLPVGYDHFVRPSQMLLNIADRSDRPIFFYHRVLNESRNLCLAEFEELLHHPKVKGIKFSSLDMRQRKELAMLKEKINFEMLEGTEWSVDEALMLGCDGALVGMGALGSKLFKEIVYHYENKEFEKMRDVQYQLIRIFWGVYGKEMDTIIEGHKYALKTLGILEHEQLLSYQKSCLTPEIKKRIETCIDENREILD